MIFNSRGKSDLGKKKKKKITSSEARERDIKHSINGNEGDLSILSYLLHDKIF